MSGCGSGSPKDPDKMLEYKIIQLENLLIKANQLLDKAVEIMEERRGMVRVMAAEMFASNELAEFKKELEDV